MHIDHIGIAVSELEHGIKQWTEIFGYTQQTVPVINSRQQVWVVFLTKKNSLTVKLIAPTDVDSPVYRFAKKGGGLHHICFKVSSVETSIKKLQDDGLRILTNPEPGEAFCNELIAFLSARNGLNIEIIDTECRANLIHEN